MSNLRYTELPTDQSTEDSLVRLALDVSWDSSDSEALWKALNPEL